MEILYSGKNRLRIRLSGREMENLGALPDGRIDCSDPDTRAALLALLQEARAEASFFPLRGRVMVEAGPDGGGGGLITFTVPPEEGRRGMAPVVFYFDSADSLIRGATRLHERYRHRIRGSSLYSWESGFRLVLFPLDYADRLSVYFLSEYALKVGEGEILAAFTDEHGHLIAENDAVETLARYFPEG